MKYADHTWTYRSFLASVKVRQTKIKFLIIWFNTKYHIWRVLALKKKNCTQFKSNCQYIGNTENRGRKQHQEKKKSAKPRKWEILQDKWHNFSNKSGHEKRWWCNKEGCYRLKEVYGSQQANAVCRPCWKSDSTKSCIER